MLSLQQFRLHFHLIITLFISGVIQRAHPPPRVCVCLCVTACFINCLANQFHNFPCLRHCRIIIVEFGCMAKVVQWHSLYPKTALHSVECESQWANKSFPVANRKRFLCFCRSIAVIIPSHPIPSLCQGDNLFIFGRYTSSIVVQRT